MFRYLLPLVIVSLVSLSQAASLLDFQQLLSYLREHYGAEAEARGSSWRQALDDSRNQPRAVQLQVINDFFNQMFFSTDEAVWGQEDYWATPLEFIGRGAGDCEDFAIAKYYSLIEVGFPAEKLRLMYVKAVNYNQHHMVLTYYEKRGAEPLVLDNIDPVIKPASLRNDLVPIYSFNADFLWLAKARGDGKQVGNSDRISLWRELQQRHSQQATER
ncbi:transglutaminase-like cysteine peptidase [Aestuariirhabdus sp. Z084]|uniref:transglutaminase-like cysteine peptidase n=1 Tax=Aestuariirhabdus haliotis TaxID=2918751 RepID=UPI00201B4345|nr:transglutaminase-like cysteine peptidase [Aestuariirhabdus haliotis]MCL6415955.1 transglutaminase-like cysteine peptidase [Aestuariirhabdus haliotis]MCL6420012.1 transglutaminase-like cysteine peptidase [Aestuariirhabdus haliotis]